MLALGALLLCVAAVAGTAVVTTPYGTIYGVDTASGRAFYGIPFAEPPVEDNRFRAPIGWTRGYSGGALNASVNAGTKCVQPSGGTEDCLVLNIWVPNTPLDVLLPVMFWIYGGGFLSGSASDNDGTALARSTTSVVVTSNYRLGALGFFALPELAKEAGTTGNYALLDQVEALRWVHAHIQLFNGDPSRVFAFGQSAGAGSMVGLLVSPMSAGLFHSAGVESAPPSSHTMPEFVQMSRTVAANAGCAPLQGSQLLQCLRAVSATDLMHADPLYHQTGAWGLVVDGTVIPAPVPDLLASGKFRKVPVLMGSNNDEGTLFGFGISHSVTPEDYPAELLNTKMVPHINDNSSALKLVLERYPPIDGDNRKTISDAIGDSRYTCNTRRILRALSKFVPTFAYRFFGKPNCTGFSHQGSFHSSEIMYVWSSAETSRCQPLVGGDAALSTAMISFWGHMAANRDPNQPNSAPKWPQYLGASDDEMGLDPTGLKIVFDVQSQQCDFWDSLE
jgi:para-nitrobenzyl esterase